MAKGAKRKAKDLYQVYEGGEPIVMPDYAMFSEVCKEAAAELGLKPAEVERVYRLFLSYSIEEMFPEGDPKKLSDEKLLNPRRIIRIPYICSAEVTGKSLWHWRKVEEKIRNKHNKTE